MVTSMDQQLTTDKLEDKKDVISKVEEQIYN